MSTTISPHVQSLLSRTHPHVHPSDTYTPPPTLADLSALFASQPTLPRTVIISCADPRCHPESIFSLDSTTNGPADAAIVLRVQGGDLVTALPGLLAIDNLLNFTEIILLKHTDCGSLVFRDDAIKAGLQETISAQGGNEKLVEEVKSMRFGQNPGTIQEAVKRDMGLLRESKLVREDLKKKAVGMVFHLETGKVEIVE